MGRFLEKLENAPLGLTYRDVLLVPKYSEIIPKDNLDLSTNFSRNIRLKIPISSSPMDTVTEAKMAIALAEEGGIGIIHRNMDAKRQAEEVKKVKEAGLKVGAAIGVFDEERAKELIKSEVDVLVLDVAHGHHENVRKSIRLYKRIDNIDIVGGNIATKEAAEDLIAAEVDGLRVGMGCGSICTTREITGVGVPQLYAIASVADVAKEYGIPVIADGGIESSGDILKALAAGAKSIMLGYLLAGTDEAPGEIITINGKKYKVYRGMGSKSVISSLDRYCKFVPEGVEGLVPYRGSVRNIIRKLIGGIKSGMGYIGAKNVQEIWQKGEFIRVTPLGSYENKPRNIIVLEKELY